MLAEAKREAERIVREAREQQARLISDEEVTKQAERAADEILNTLEVNLQKFLAAVQRGRDRLAGRDEEQQPVAELDEQEQALFRRVREHSRSLVIGDTFEPGELERVVEWCGGEVVWQVDDLAVIRAIY